MNSVNMRHVTCRYKTRQGRTVAHEKPTFMKERRLQVLAVLRFGSGQKLHAGQQVFLALQTLNPLEPMTLQLG